MCSCFVQPVQFKAHLAIVTHSSVGALRQCIVHVAQPRASACHDSNGFDYHRTGGKRFPTAALYHRVHNPVYADLLDRLGSDPDVHAVVLPRLREQADELRRLALPPLGGPPQRARRGSFGSPADRGGARTALNGQPSLHDHDAPSTESPSIMRAQPAQNRRSVRRS